MSKSVLYGLIGYPLGHSFSKRYFTEKFEREGIADARYELFPLETVDQLPTLVAQHPDLRGLNVTIPHKQAVIPLLHELDETAQSIGAVNVIKIGPNGYLKGFNSDAHGFEVSLKRVLSKLGIFIEPEAKNTVSMGGLCAFILGTGGASKAAAYVLNRYNIPFQFVSRQPEGNDQVAYEALPDLLPAKGRVLWVNTTPLGTFPNIESKPPVPMAAFRPNDAVFDLVYNPETTLFMALALERGLVAQNGLEMLHQQAEAAWAIWNALPII